MTDPIPAEAVEAGVAEMFDHGWTCEYHEPDDSCETCRKAHKSTVHDILTAAAPTIAAQATADLRAGIEALRDKWRKSESEAPGFDYAMSRAADALDVLLRGAK